jgi:Ca2+-binding EF-hand superfamily protein
MSTVNVGRANGSACLRPSAGQFVETGEIFVPNHLFALPALFLAASAAPALAQSAAAPAQPTRADIKTSLENRFKAIDADGDGAVDKAEIAAANSRLAEQTSVSLDKRMEAEFAKVDSNNDQMISIAEFKATAPDPKPTPVDTTLERMDANKDGKISFDEFGGNMLTAFDRLDADKDGRLSQAEQRAAGR